MSYRDIFFKNNKSDHGWYTCAYCGRKYRKDDIDVDHKISQAHGGSDNASNLTAACPHCNRQKGSMDSGDYENWRDLYQDEADEEYERNEKKYGSAEAMRREANSHRPYIK